MGEAPQEEQAPEEEDSFYRKATKYCNFGGEGGQVPGQLRGMLQRLSIPHAPEYVIKRVPQPGRDVYTVKGDVYDYCRLLNIHHSPAPRLTEGVAVADAAWEAMTYYSYVYRHRLTGSIYCLFPRMRRGRADYTLAPLSAEVLRRDAIYSQDMVLNLSGRLQSSLGEICALEEMLRDTEATLRARLRMQ